MNALLECFQDDLSPVTVGGRGPTLYVYDRNPLPLKTYGGYWCAAVQHPNGCLDPVLLESRWSRSKASAIQNMKWMYPDSKNPGPVFRVIIGPDFNLYDCNGFPANRGLFESAKGIRLHRLAADYVEY